MVDLPAGAAVRLDRGHPQAVLADLVHGERAGGVRVAAGGLGTAFRHARADRRRGAEHAPSRDGARGVTLRVIRVLAPNPSVATLEGTNTWVVGDQQTIVIDPGPAIDEHLEEVARAAGRVAHVLVTHDHEDHAAGAGGVSRRLGPGVSPGRAPPA